MNLAILILKNRIIRQEWISGLRANITRRREAAGTVIGFGKGIGIL
jgi:hypothetical protein